MCANLSWKTPLPCTFCMSPSFNSRTGLKTTVLHCCAKRRRRGEKGIGTVSTFPDLTWYLDFSLFDKESCAQTETHTCTNILYTYSFIIIIKKKLLKKGHFLLRKKKGRCSSPPWCLCVHVTCLHFSVFLSQKWQGGSFLQYKVNVERWIAPQPPTPVGVVFRLWRVSLCLYW